MTTLSRIADRALNRPLLILPDKLAIIGQVLSGRIGLDDVDAIDGAEFDEDGKLSPNASAFVGASRPRTPYRQHGDTAIISITGSLINRGAFIGAQSGLTSYEGISHQIKTAMADPKVASILLDIDSPGGEAVGAFETADLIREANQRKPIYGAVNGICASAAFALASGCKAIVATQSSIVGSVGVVMMHLDHSRALDMAGIKPTFVFAGKHKTSGNPYEKLSKDVKSDLQAEINSLYDLFLQTVGAGRGSRFPASAAKKSEARTFIGADAKKHGLIDDVGSFDEILHMLSSSNQTKQIRGNRTMAINPKFLDPYYDADAEVEAKAAKPDPRYDPAYIDARIAGANAERHRLKTLLSTETAKRNPLAALEAALSPVATHDTIEAAVRNATSAGQAAADAAWRELAERHNAQLHRQAGQGMTDTKEMTRVDLSSVPSQAGAVSWDDVAAKLNAERGAR